MSGDAEEIHIDDPVRVYLREIGRIPKLTREDESAMPQRLGPGEDAANARRRLVEANLGLAAVIAGRYADRGVHLLDLIQQANAGLVAAAGRFDSTCRRKFSTYAAWPARRAILRKFAPRSDAAAR